MLIKREGKGMEKKALRRILRASEKASKEYEKAEKRLKNDKDLMMFTLLQITCRGLEEIEAIVRKELDMRGKEEDA
jgi:CRISPR/Cas system CSM-associated protein Csm2 small subunit